MAKSLLDLLKSSNSELLKAEYSDFSKWSSLKHDKESLELILQFNLLHLKYLNSKHIYEDVICTGNTALIKIISTKKKEDKKKLVDFKGPAMHTNDKRSVLVWDLVDNKPKTIKLSNWSIIDFLTIQPENVLILDEVIKKVLKI